MSCKKRRAMTSAYFCKNSVTAKEADMVSSIAAFRSSRASFFCPFVIHLATLRDRASSTPAQERKSQGVDRENELVQSDALLSEGMA